MSGRRVCATASDGQRRRPCSARSGARRRRFARGTAGSRVLPDCLLIGTQRGGTTTRCSTTCCSIRRSSAPSPTRKCTIFDRPGFTAIDDYRPRSRLERGPSRGERSAGGRVVVGEATPYYLFHPAVPGRVAAALPDVRLIAILRDPVERAWSQYRHECRPGVRDAALRRGARRVRTSGSPVTSSACSSIPPRRRSSTSTTRTSRGGATSSNSNGGGRPCRASGCCSFEARTCTQIPRARSTPLRPISASSRGSRPPGARTTHRRARVSTP